MPRTSARRSDSSGSPLASSGRSRASAPETGTTRAGLFPARKASTTRKSSSKSAARAALFEEDFLVVDVLRDGKRPARVVPVSGADARDLPDDVSGDPLESLRRALVLGIRFDVLSIGPLFEDARRTLAPLFGGLKEDATEENEQSRLRGMLLMAVSNKKGPLVLTTGNKSELAVGYCTLYGDMCGGLAPISDLPKMRVYALARHLNARAGRALIPGASLTKAPSAELRPGQTDQDSLPPYPLLDAILENLVERNLSLAAAARRTGAPLALVRKIAMLVDRAEYKRRQAT